MRDDPLDFIGRFEWAIYYVCITRVWVCKGCCWLPVDQRPRLQAWLQSRPCLGEIQSEIHQSPKILIGGRCGRLPHTHLIRNILSNYWCGVHRSCTNNSVNLPGKLYRRFGVRNLSEVLMRLSSDAAHPDCENRTVVWIWNCWKTTCRFLA